MKKVVFLTSLIIYTFVSGCANQNSIETKNINEVDQVKVKPTEAIENNLPSNSNKTNIISQDEALRRVEIIVESLPKGYFLNFDHIEKVNNKEYYVFHLYESIIDNKQTGEGHSVTYGWYYVDKSNGQISKMDMSTGNLTKVIENELGLLKQEDTSYKQYTNGRFGFSIEYPSTFVTKVTPDNNDGLILASSDGDTELTISGTNNVLSETALTYYNNLLKEHDNASYKKQENNWLAVSWVEGDKIVYQKTVVGRGSINTFLLKYPLKKKEAFDLIVSHLFSSFKTPAIDNAH